MAPAIDGCGFGFPDAGRLDAGQADVVGMARASIADPEILTKIQGCMSQRAWATVAEELEVAGSTSQDDVDAARAEIVQVMAMLDQSGELQMEE